MSAVERFRRGLESLGGMTTGLTWDEQHRMDLVRAVAALEQDLQRSMAFVHLDTSRLVALKRWDHSQELIALVTAKVLADDNPLYLYAGSKIVKDYLDDVPPRLDRN